MVTSDYDNTIFIDGSKEEADQMAQYFVRENFETHPTATVIRLHKSGNPLKNKIVSYVTKDEILKYELGGSFAPNVADGTAFMDNSYFADGGSTGSGFDPVNANIIKDEILALQEQGSTIIFSTHRMESVEELCDHIALIHQSNKLIEGRLDDVKKQFRTNSFEVGILTDNVEGLMLAITQNYTIQPTNFKSLNNELKLEINLGNSLPNELLNLLTSRGQVTHFVEKIPSVNDIFIQTVSQ